jgi:hypothetical protein
VEVRFFKKGILKVYIDNCEWTKCILLQPNSKREFAKSKICNRAWKN